MTDQEFRNEIIRLRQALVKIAELASHLAPMRATIQILKVVKEALNAHVK